MEKGFNDFLAKPIDVSKLDEMLEHWISREKKEKGEIRNEKGKEPEGRKLILLVDDNPANLRLGISALEEKYDIITAPSAEKMLKLLASNNPDVIIMNETMRASVLPEQFDKWSDRVVFINEAFDQSILIRYIEDSL